MFAKDFTGCFSHCCAEGNGHWIHVCIFIIYDGERCKLFTCHGLECFQYLGIFQLFEVKLESFAFLACWFFLNEGGRLWSASYGDFQCLLLEDFMFWYCSLLIGSTPSRGCNQSDCDVVHFGYARSIFWMLWPKVFANTTSWRAANSRSQILGDLERRWVPPSFPKAHWKDMLETQHRNTHEEWRLQIRIWRILEKDKIPKLPTPVLVSLRATLPVPDLSIRVIQ